MVEDGEYAVLEQLTDNGSNMYYYKRYNNIWFPDENIDSSQFTDDNKVLYNLDSNCVNINDKCEDISDGKSTLENDNIKLLLNEFDINLRKSIQEIKTNIQMNTKNL